MISASAEVLPDFNSLWNFSQPLETQNRFEELSAATAQIENNDERAKKWLGTLYNNMGWTFHDSGKFLLALEMFQKALAFRETQGEIKSIRIARWSVARVHRSLGNLQEALLIQQGLEREFDLDGGSDPFVFEELAELNLILHQQEISSKYFALAYAQLSQDPWFAAHEPVRLARMRDLSR